ncbi:MAG: helix-turn-helix transcriptional regulator [Chitinispirillia bacterium]|jgi:transcriptional regulator with XRE-family HTH domain
MSEKMGQRLQEFRNSLNMKQKQLALELELGENAQSVLSLWETNKDGRKIPHYIIEKLYKKYDLNINWLYTGDGPMKIQDIIKIGSQNTEPELGAFIQFAQEDRIAKDMVKVFDFLDIPIYCPGNTVAESNLLECKEIITKKIKLSRCFIPIYSRSYLNNTLCIHAGGAAQASGKPIFPALVKGFPIHSQLIVHGRSKFRIYIEEELLELIREVCKLSPDHSNDVIENKISELKSEKHILLTGITGYSKRRWIFLSGSSQGYDYEVGRKNKDEYFTGLFPNKKIYEKNISYFVTLLVEKLIKNGFSIGSCPSAPGVGKDATLKAIEMMPSSSVSQDYTISSIHQLEKIGINDELRNKPDALRRWKEYVFVFREHYLSEKNYEYILLIGGSQGTLDHFDTVNSLSRTKDTSRIKPICIPCFFGVSRTIYNTLKHYELICEKCQRKETHGNKYLDEYAERVTRFLKDNYLDD